MFAQEVAGRDVRKTELVSKPSGLGALAHAGGSDEDEREGAIGGTRSRRRLLRRWA
jgi:hypothetical protein